jgi:hypothetical protein
VFKLDRSGVLTVLHNFTGGADGGDPVFRLATDTNGVFYGTTGGEGGEVFRLDSGSGDISVLHHFASRPADGLEAGGGVLNVGGSLFGVADFGGITNTLCSIGCGVVYGWSTAGYTILHSFTGGDDGAAPSGALMVGAEGGLYGAAALGGNSGNGVIFKITP